MGEIVLDPAEDDLDVAGDVDLAHAVGSIGKRQTTDIDIVARGDDYLEHRLDLLFQRCTFQLRAEHDVSRLAIAPDFALAPGFERISQVRH